MNRTFSFGWSCTLFLWNCLNILKLTLSCEITIVYKSKLLLLFIENRKRTESTWTIKIFDFLSRTNLDKVNVHEPNCWSQISFNIKYTMKFVYSRDFIIKHWIEWPNHKRLQWIVLLFPRNKEIKIHLYLPIEKSCHSITPLSRWDELRPEDKLKNCVLNYTIHCRVGICKWP